MWTSVSIFYLLSGSGTVIFGSKSGCTQMLSGIGMQWKKGRGIIPGHGELHTVFLCHHKEDSEAEAAGLPSPLWTIHRPVPCFLPPGRSLMGALCSLLLLVVFLDGDLSSVSATSSYRLSASRDSQTCMDTNLFVGLIVTALLSYQTCLSLLQHMLL